MKITVTQKHIDRGIRGKATDCPLAIAINEQCPAYEASVTLHSVWLISLANGSLQEYPITREAFHFVSAFDAGVFNRRWWHWFKAPRPLERTFDFPLPEPVATPRRARTSVFDGLETSTTSS